MGQETRLRVNSGEGYDILIEKSFDRLSEELDKLGCRGRRICIITDDNVSAYYLSDIYDIALKIASKVNMIAIPAGEENKNLETVGRIYEALIRHEYDRGDFLIALGGGVVGDICGFAAATYLRGIRFIQIPTSLLAQVDSSIGGKTGVDFNSYKNMVGAFHMPSLVYINISTLKTLPDREFASGMGEVIKHGFIRSEEYVKKLEDNFEAVSAREPEACMQMVLISDRIKQAVVEEDPNESGIRGILNFGHTLGHAIEKEMKFKLSHGACVGLGMLCAAHICAERGLIDRAALTRLEKLLERYGLETKISGADETAIIKATRNDKKMEAGSIKFILLKGIGGAYIDRSVTEEEMLAAVRSIIC